MESTSTPQPSQPPPPRRVDAAADLKLLSRAKSEVEIDQFLDFGPWWYAPGLATVIAGGTLFAESLNNNWNVVMGLAALGAGTAVIIHDYRRRGVRVQRSSRSFKLSAVVVVLMYLIVGLWGTAISSVGYERFVPGYAVLGWVITSLFFLGIRQVLMEVRRRRAPLS